jgi:hypothetical protein
MTAPKKSKTPAFPAPVDLPEPPSFGWVLNPLRLTGNEANEIAEQCGVNPFATATGEEAMTVGAYIAVAYARRVDPEKYPWKVAGNIPLGSMSKSFPDENQQEAILSDAISRSLENGEEAPHPS